MAKSSRALSNLRAVVIVIVLAFHASLAYLASAPAPTSDFGQPPYNWQAFPIVDSQRWLGFDLFCAWQDVSLMSLMFLLSGLLAAGSLARKGTTKYIVDRLWRIGLPFALAVIFLSPLSYYPAYLARAGDPSLAGFWNTWMTLPFWPAGPQWFLWQLLVLNLFAASLYAMQPGAIVRLGRMAGWTEQRPLAFLTILVGASMLAYVPLALRFSPWSWGAVGPLALQFSRPLHYVVYFVAGLALGAHGIERGLLAPEGPLARHWRRWLIAAAASFLAWAGLTSLTFPDWNQSAPAARLAASLAFPLACAAGGLALLALCLRFAAGMRWRPADSLSANAYSIYLVHYVFIVWLQYALLDSGLFVVLKPAIVLAGALALSWTASVVVARLMAGAPPATVKPALAPIAQKSGRLPERRRHAA
jgi:peptidoglycan/LPS O-acetylase OafA/YrhL